MKTYRPIKNAAAAGILLATSAIGTTALAAPPKILGVITDPKSPTFVIIGNNFNALPKLSVLLNDFADITDLCQPDFSVIPQLVNCTFPQSISPDDYRLNVTVSDGTKTQTDHYDFTVGREGPPGPTGLPGNGIGTVYWKQFDSSISDQNNVDHRINKFYALCNGNDTVIGGGFWLDGHRVDSSYAIKNAPSDDFHGWNVTMYVSLRETSPIHVYAICTSQAIPVI